MLTFSCGDIVRERGGRHHGRVESVRSSFLVHVRWLGSGWRSVYLIEELERVPVEDL